MRQAFFGFSLLLNLVGFFVVAAMFVDIKNTMVFDLDLVRTEYVEKNVAAWRRGCIAAASDYDCANRYERGGGFNYNSPMMWCAEQVKNEAPTIESEAVTLGKIAH